MKIHNILGYSRDRSIPPFGAQLCPKKRKEVKKITEIKRGGALKARD